MSASDTNPNDTTPAPSMLRGPPLRVGITCYPTFGGSGVIASEMGLELARRGHRVHFISYDLPNRVDRFLDNVSFHEVEARDYPLFQEPPYPLALASKMVEVSRYEGLDVLHVHYAVPHATSAYLARQILGAAAPKIVTTLHGTDITLVGGDPSYLPITRFSIEVSDAVTAPSQYLRQATYDLLSVDPARSIEVIPNFVDAERYRPAARRPLSELRHLIGRPLKDAGDARPRILTHVSNFRPLKRVDDVVRIFAAVREKTPAYLALVGDGPERSRIEGMVRDLHLHDSVWFLGKQLSFVELLQSSDVFLMPSEMESFGLAALEAMACGVPVVASNVGGIPEVVAEGESGYLAPLGDVATMAKRVLDILSDNALHTRLSKTARRRVEERWTTAPAVDRYEDCYRRVIAA